MGKAGVYKTGNLEHLHSEMARGMPLSHQIKIMEGIDSAGIETCDSRVLQQLTKMLTSQGASVPRNFQVAYVSSSLGDKNALNFFLHS